LRRKMRCGKSDCQTYCIAQQKGQIIEQKAKTTAKSGNLAQERLIQNQERALRFKDILGDVGIMMKQHSRIGVLVEDLTFRSRDAKLFKLTIRYAKGNGNSGFPWELVENKVNKKSLEDWGQLNSQYVMSESSDFGDAGNDYIYATIKCEYIDVMGIETDLCQTDREKEIMVAMVSGAKEPQRGVLTSAGTHHKFTGYGIASLLTIAAFAWIGEAEIMVDNAGGLGGMKTYVYAAWARDYKCMREESNSFFYVEPIHMNIDDKLRNLENEGLRSSQSDVGEKIYFKKNLIKGNGKC